MQKQLKLKTIMKKLLSVASLLLFTIIISCNDSEIETNQVLIKEDLSFIQQKNPDRDLSLALGIQSFTNGKFLDASTFTFDIIAEISAVNSQLLNLNETKVVIQKLATRTYRIAAHFSEIGDVSLTFDQNSGAFSYKLNGKEFTSNMISPSDSKNQLALVTLSNLFVEATQLNKLSSNNDNDANSGRVQKKYYGYTVGWGFTAEESVDHEASVRAGATANIEKYKCELLGTSTTCVIGSIGCTTISTFSCDDGVPVPPAE